ncbi:uridine kinase [Lysinibacillus sp. 2017]|uniref:kinase n=1 Tax=unclassified Lysinibacillus TaxID=2636778 RepID=UPI000D5281DF|nr:MULTISPECIES: kinase [unclassified Lysinibacillus]AWE07296.1 uridine kinase [Lysinibacillus sp. 2017]TGN30797.1 uridine kinase [Lysinibacillus sp. S2017]
MDKYDDLIRQINDGYKKHVEARPYIVAIDGLSGAGKTTLVNHLKEMLDNLVIIHIDDHIVEQSKRYNTGHDEWFEYYQLQWDSNYLKEELFDKLYTNEKCLHLPFYNKINDTFTQQEIKIAPNNIIVIEGIFLLRDEWKNFYDYIVFLDCPKEIRYERVLHRDTYIGNLEERLNKYKRRYWPAEEYYLKNQKPLDLAHSIQKSF